MSNRNQREVPFPAIVVILLAITIVVLSQVNREFPLQYMENGEMKTEVFNSPKEYNKRAKELQADSIKYWLDLNK